MLKDLSFLSEKLQHFASAATTRSFCYLEERKNRNSYYEQPNMLQNDYNKL